MTNRYKLRTVASAFALAFLANAAIAACPSEGYCPPTSQELSPGRSLITVAENVVAGAPITVTAKVAGNKLYNGVVAWKITSADGTSQSFTQSFPLVFTPSVPGKMKIEIDAQHAADATKTTHGAREIKVIDPNSLTKPTVSLVIPTKVEAGQRIDLKARVSNPSLRGTSLKAVYNWELPDGTVLHGENVKYKAVGTAGETQIVRFNTFVPGADAQTNVRAEGSYNLSPFVMPEFGIVVRGDGQVAPATVRVAAIPKTSVDGREMSGKDFKYVWTDASGVTLAEGQVAALTFAEPGSYQVGLSVNSGSEVNRLATTTITVGTPAPLAVGYTLKPDNIYERAPTTYIVTKPGITGGPNGDRIQSVTAKLDGNVVFEGSRMPSFIKVDHAGNHDIIVDVQMKSGATAQKVTAVSVVENQAPDCAGLDPVLSEDGKTVSFDISCHDNDGKIKSYTWRVNQILSRASGPKLTLSADQAPFLVNVVVKDDSGVGTERSFEYTGM